MKEIQEIHEIPSDILLAMSVNPVKREYFAWRVVAYRPDGSYWFVPNRSGYDYKLKRNAENEAYRQNNISGGRYFATVKRIRISETEIEQTV